MKILLINAGSSSLKYQLLDMKTEKVVAKGNCEKIGLAGPVISLKANGKTMTFDGAKNHDEAISKVLDILTNSEYGVPVRVNTENLPWSLKNLAKASVWSFGTPVKSLCFADEMCFISSKNKSVTSRSFKCFSTQSCLDASNINPEVSTAVCTPLNEFKVFIAPKSKIFSTRYTIYTRKF